VTATVAPPTGDRPATGRLRRIGAALLPEAGPQRILTVATFVNSSGKGALLTSSALFLTQSVGLSATQVGLGLGAAVLVGLLAGVPVGTFADRRGPRETYMVTLLIEAVAVSGYTLVHNVWTLLPVACATELAAASSQATRGPLIRGFGGPELVRFRGYLRSVTNLGIAIGALGAGFAVQIDTRTGYVVLILGNSVTFALCSLVVSRLPHLPPVPRPPVGQRRAALADRPFVALTLLNGIMAIQYAVGTFAVPLWIVEFTQAPRWTVSAAMITNTAIVVVLQTRASRGIGTPQAAGRAMRRAGFVFLAGFGMIALTGRLSAIAAISIILIGVAVCTIGELWHAAAGFEISFGLAPAHAQGQYTGVFNMGLGVGTALAPSLLSVACIGWGPPGWFAVGGLMVAVGLAAPLAVRWAEHTRIST
jgi:predicted MFS family arabinose efflux permease